MCSPPSWLLMASPPSSSTTRSPGAPAPHRRLRPLARPGRSISATMASSGRLREQARAPELGGDGFHGPHCIANGGVGVELGDRTCHSRQAKRRAGIQRQLSPVRLDSRFALRASGNDPVRVSGNDASAALTPSQADGLSQACLCNRFSPTAELMTDTVLIIDFGSQVTQLIARRVREQGVYSEIVPFNRAEDALERLQAQGRDPVGRARQRHRVRHAARARLGVQGRACPCSASATASRPWWRRWAAGSKAATTASSAAPSSRSPPTARCSRACGSKGDRDTVWMSHGDRVTQAARRLQGGGRVEGRAVRGHRRREAQALRRAVPPRGGAHARAAAS